MGRLLGTWIALGLLGCSLDGEAIPGVQRDPVLDGEPDTTNRHVVLVAIGASGLCTGALILPNLVLTARHCVAEVGSEGVVACDSSEFGSQFRPSDFAITWDDDINDGVDESSIYDVSAVSTPTDNALCGTDIALLQLSSNVPAAQATPATPRIDAAPRVGDYFDVVGYGLTNPDDDTSAGARMRAEDSRVSCVGAVACGGTGVTDAEWAAADAPACEGDSGGPALDTSGRVTGVVSRGAPDCSLTVYSGVFAWRDLIVDAAIEAVGDGGYDPPPWVTGMSSTGGASTGGASTGGASTGGASTGGASTGGASTGGASTGGASTGGASSGGAGSVSGGAGPASAGVATQPDQTPGTGDDGSCSFRTSSSGRGSPWSRLLFIASFAGLVRRPWVRRRRHYSNAK